MVSVDEILSIIACFMFAGLFVGFLLRIIKSRWTVYYFLLAFALLRIVAYSIRAYIDSGAISPADSAFINLYITESILLSLGAIVFIKVLARLYGSILPKLRSQSMREPDLFERYVVERTKLFLLPLVALIIAGATLSTPDHSASQLELGATLRKIGICLLLILGLWFWYAAFTYRNIYSDNVRAFNIALITTTLMDISLVYKVVYAFYPQAQTTTAAFFILSPLIEFTALCVLCVDLKSHFLGHPFANDVEIQPTSGSGYHDV